MSEPSQTSNLVLGVSIALASVFLISIGLSTQRKKRKYKPCEPAQLCEYKKGEVQAVISPDDVRPVKTALTGLASHAPVRVFDLFTAAKDRHGSEEAMKFEKEPGNWQSITWKGYYDTVLQVARAFIQLGLQKNESVNIIGFNSPEWFISNLAAIAGGGMAAGIYTTNGPEACRYIVEHSAARVVVVENNKQLEKFVGWADDVKGLSAIVVYGESKVPESLRKGLSRVRVLTWAEVLELGKDEDGKLAQILSARLASQRPSDCCTLIYTSGTTGPPKAVMISHDNVTWTASAVQHEVPILGEGIDDHVISYLPLSHIAAQLADIHVPLFLTARFRNCTVWFARPDALKGSLSVTLKAARPTLFFGVPRVWEKFQEAMAAAGAKSTGLKKHLGTFAKSVGLADYRGGQTNRNASRPILFPLFNKLVYSKVREALGLDRSKILLTGAAPIASSTLEYFGSLGCRVNNLYGMSECTGPQNFQQDLDYITGSCGRPVEGTEVRIDHQEGRDKKGEGEICYRGRHIMLGYMKDLEKTKQAIDDEGFLHSGDVGRVDEFGHLHITGRIKELIIGAGGENIAPVPIEDFVKLNLPAVSNAVMIGDGRKYNIILLTLKTTLLEDGSCSGKLDGAAKTVTSATTVVEARRDPAYISHLQAGIEKYNNTQAVSQAQKLQYFAVLPRDLTVTTGELTPTLKLKRSVIADTFRKVIDALYADNASSAAASAL